MKQVVVLALVVVLAVVLLPVRAGAQEYFDEAESDRTRLWAGIGADLMGQRDDAQQLIFGDFVWQVRVHGSYVILPHLDLIASVGIRFQDGRQRAMGNLPQPIATEDELWVVPYTLGLRARLFESADAWAVPWIAGGPMGAYFYSAQGADPGDDAVWGFKWGVWGEAGILWKIDELDRHSRRSLRADGIVGLYLSTAFHWQWLDNFGDDGLDLSAFGGYTGLEVRFGN